MLCLSDIQLFSLLLCKMAPRCVRKGHGSVPVSRKEGLRSRSVFLCGSPHPHWPLWQWCLFLTPSFALWASSAIVCGLVSAWASHREAPWLTGSSAPVGITEPSEVLPWLPPNSWTGPTLCPSPSQALLQVPQPSDQLCLEFALTQGHVETSRSYPCLNKTSSYSEKPNSFCKPCCPTKQYSDITPKSWGSAAFETTPSRVSKTSAPHLASPITQLTLLSTLSWSLPEEFWAQSRFSCFCSHSLFQSPRPEEGVFLLLLLAVCLGLLLSNLGQKRWAPSSFSSLLSLLLLSVLWLSLNSQWGGQERERLKNNLTFAERYFENTIKHWKRTRIFFEPLKVWVIKI